VTAATLSLVRDSLDPTRGPRLGRVARVDTCATVVQVQDAGLMSRVTVNDLVAARGRAPGEHLIALVSAVASGAAGEPGVNDTAAGVVRLGLVGTLVQGDRGGADRFIRGAHTFPSIGSDCHVIEDELLVRFMSILGDNVPPDERLVLGRFVAEQGAAAIADGNKLFQRHLAVLGSTGAGKSWTVALMLERAARLNHANIIVLDMHGEYGPLTMGEDGRPPIARGLRIAAPGEEAGENVIFVPYWLLDRDEMLSLVLDETDPDAASQAMRFTDHIYKLKRGTLFEIGHEDIADTFTVDSPIPYRLSTLLSWLKSDDTEKIVRQPSGNVEPGPYYDRLTRFVGRLEARISDGRYGFMFSPPDECLEYGWLERFVTSLLDAGLGRPGIKVIDFSEVPAEALPVVVGVIARLIYDVQFWMDPDRRTPISFVCDEAHLYLPVSEAKQPVHRVALRAFEEIAKEGRKYGVGLMVVTQRPADVSRTVIAQCNNFIVMRLTNDRDQQVIEQLVPESLARLTDVLPLLEVGEAVVLGDALLLPTPVRFDPPAIKPASATRAFWTDWSAQPTSTAAIVDGVEALRRQIRFDGEPAMEQPHPI
jgi:DNA helicase HerA-like ATPase